LVAELSFGFLQPMVADLLVVSIRDKNSALAKGFEQKNLVRQGTPSEAPVPKLQQ